MIIVPDTVMRLSPHAAGDQARPSPVSPSPDAQDDTGPKQRAASCSNTTTRPPHAAGDQARPSPSPEDVRRLSRCRVRSGRRPSRGTSGSSSGAAPLHPSTSPPAAAGGSVGAAAGAAACAAATGSADGAATAGATAGAAAGAAAGGSALPSSRTAARVYPPDLWKRCTYETKCPPSDVKVAEMPRSSSCDDETVVYLNDQDT